jgi:ABC-2 type transport system ATP-binding protein
LFAVNLGNTPQPGETAIFEIINASSTNGDQRLIVKINEGYTPNDVLIYFLQKNVMIMGFYELLPSLNDIFIRLVEGTPLSRQFQKISI